METTTANRRLPFQWLFALVCVVAASLQAVAQDFRTEPYEGGGLKIVQYLNDDVDVVIPAEIHGVPVTAIGEAAFAGFWFDRSSNQIETVVLPDTITVIEGSAFAQMARLRAITLNGGLVSIGDLAFAGSAALADAALPSTIETIGMSAFFGCDLRSVTIPSRTDSIGGGAFSANPNLAHFEVAEANPHYKSVGGVLYDKGQEALLGAYVPDRTVFIIPDGVKTLGVRAFVGNAALERVEIPTSVATIGEPVPTQSWWGQPTTGGPAFGANEKLTEIIVDPLNPQFADLNGVLFNKDLMTLIAFPAAQPGHYEVPAGTEIIGQYAFLGSSAVSSVFVPDSVRSIDLFAFGATSNLKSIRLPNSLSHTSEQPFSLGMFGGSSVTSIYIEGDAPTWAASGIDLDATIFYDPATAGWGTAFADVGVFEFRRPLAMPGTFQIAYRDWIAGYPSVGELTAIGDDPDKDGTPNGLEQFLGTDPTQVSPGIEFLPLSRNALQIVYLQGDGIARDLSIHFNWSTDLEHWASLAEINIGDPYTLPPRATFEADTPTPGLTTLTISSQSIRAGLRFPLYFSISTEEAD